MAAARDQAARIVRPEPDVAEREPVRDASAVIAEQLRAHLSEDTVAPLRRDAGTVPSPSHQSRPRLQPQRRAEIRQAQKDGPDRCRRACSRSPPRPMAYIIFWLDVFWSAPTTPMSAPTTPRSARGFRDMSRRSSPATTRWCGPARWSSRSTMAITASRWMPRAPRIATQQATIERIGRQITAQESAVEQAKAQLASAEAGLKRAGLDYDRQQALSNKGFASRATFEAVRSRDATRASRR